jgi:membrane protein
VRLRLRQQLVDEVRASVRARRDQAYRHPVLGEVVELIEGTFSGYVFGHGLMYAAAIAFYTLLSLIPLLVLFASAAGYAMHFFGGDAPEQMDALLEDVMRQLKRAIPYVDDGFEQDLRRLVDNRGGLGVFSLGALLFTASGMFRALEYSFAHVFADLEPTATASFKAPTPRNVVLSKLLFGGLLLIVVVGFLAARFALSMVVALLEHLPAPLVQLWVESPLQRDNWGTLLVEAVLVVVGFAVVLKSFTSTRVRFRFALLGGALFYLLFEVAQRVYEFYLDRWSDLGALYGSFSAIMIAVLWIFYAALILLLCGYFVKTVQRRALSGPRVPKDP